ncbi:MAG: hypothetical protein ACK5WZ_01810, partial [Pseudobdellovibrionaceae bacterium]
MKTTHFFYSTPFIVLVFFQLSCAHLSKHQMIADQQDDYFVEPYDFSPYPSASQRQPSGIVYQYRNDDRSCDGFPQLPITSFDGSCVGLALDSSTAPSLLMPRKIIQLPDSDDFLLVDMGGWSAGKGKVYRLSKGNGNRLTATAIITKLNSPHDIEIGPDGKIYVGEIGRIFRFDYRSNQPQPESVILNFPKPTANQNHLHPLVNFSFGKTAQDMWDIYANVGSASDACKTAAPGRCPEVETKDFAAVWKFKYLGNGQWNKQKQVFARGLRNSMALEAHTSGVILQAENARDLKSKDEPFEELNVLT